MADPLNLENDPVNVTVSIIPSPENEPHDLMIEVDGQHLALTVDDARKLRDALCIMVGMPSKRKKAPGRSQES